MLESLIYSELEKVLNCLRANKLSLNIDESNFVIFRPVQRKLPKQVLLYSWRFSRYSAPIHWVVHGRMTSNNETVSRQMP